VAKLSDAQFSERDKLMHLSTRADYVHFDCLGLSTCDALIAAGLMDPEQTQNESPTVSEFVDFMRKHPGALAHGYTIGGGRDDARVSIEGLTVGRQHVNSGLLTDFVNSFRHADEFSIDPGLRCWWD